jgi:hypothetical protein
MSGPPNRSALPLRRQSVTIAADHDGQAFTLTVGLYDDGRPGEVFADHHKSGSAMQAILSDACVLVSIALQHGISPEALGRSLGRVPAPWRDEGDTNPASPLGTIVAALGGWK